jgi:hypothetical protein
VEVEVAAAGGKRYRLEDWQEHTLALREQIAAMQEGPLWSA